MSNPDWDTYYCKHAARLHGWLPAALEYHQELNQAVIKYFTLPDIPAIDIFMLEQAGVLKRDQNGLLPHVVICEEDERKVADIERVVRPPIREAIINASLQDVLTFQDDPLTLHPPPQGWVRSRRDRYRLYLKRSFERLRLFFPFNIINFDPCDNMLTPQIGSNKIYRALERIFVLQKAITEFLLFITTPIAPVHAETLEQFRRDLQNNTESHKDLKDSLLALTGSLDFDQLDEHKRIAIGVAKSVLIRAAHKEGWTCEHKGIYIYENHSGNNYLSSVVRCTQVGNEINPIAYVQDILGIINHMPEYYPYSVSSNDQEIKNHLDGVVAFREASKTAN